MNMKDAWSALDSDGRFSRHCIDTIHMWCDSLPTYCDAHADGVAGVYEYKVIRPIDVNNTDVGTWIYEGLQRKFDSNQFGIAASFEACMIDPFDLTHVRSSMVIDHYMKIAKKKKKKR